MHESSRRGFYFAPKCARCGMSTGIYEILGPGDVPERWGCWDERSKRLHVDQTDVRAWRMLVVAGVLNNGVVGERIDLDDQRAAELRRRLEARDVQALAEVADDLLGLCEPCGEFYCQPHWAGEQCPQGHARGAGASTATRT